MSFLSAVDSLQHLPTMAGDVKVPLWLNNSGESQDIAPNSKGIYHNGDESLMDISDASVCQHVVQDVIDVTDTMDSVLHEVESSTGDSVFVDAQSKASSSHGGDPNDNFMDTLSEIDFRNPLPETPSTPHVEFLEQLSPEVLSETTDIISSREIVEPVIDKTVDNCVPSQPSIAELNDSHAMAANVNAVYDGDDEPPIPKGGYNIDWDNLDNLDPFSGGKVGMKNSPGLVGSDANKNALDAQPSREDLSVRSSATPERFGTASVSPMSVYGTPEEVAGEANNLNRTTEDGSKNPRSSDDTPKVRTGTYRIAKGSARSSAPRSVPDAAESDPVPQSNFVPPANAKSQLPANYTQRSASQTAVVQPLVSQLQGSGVTADMTMGNSELFDDPKALDYLLSNAGTADQYVESDLYRQSLYVNFDPLVQAAAQNRAIVVPQVASENNQLSVERDMEGDDLISMKTPTPGKNRRTPVGGGAGTREVEDSPTCPPTVVKKRAAAPQSQESSTALGGNLGAVDRLLAPSPLASLTNGNHHLVAPFEFCGDEEDLLDDVRMPDLLPKVQNISNDGGEPSLTRMRLQHQAELVIRDKEWSHRFSEVERKLQEKEKEAAQLKQNVSDMTGVIAEYDKTIRQTLTANSEKLRLDSGESVEEIVRQRDQALEDLQGAESSFSELYRRYEKLKTTTEEFRKNEEELKEKITDYQSKLKRAEDRFHRLKDQAEQKLAQANQEIERLQQLRETDTLGLKAQLKRNEVQIESYEKQVEHKNKEINELTKICDELISKASAARSS